MRPDFLSRRAANLASTLPAGAPATNLAFDSGHACNIVLPDLTAEAQRALTEYRLETLQYAPREDVTESIGLGSTTAYATNGWGDEAAVQFRPRKPATTSSYDTTDHCARGLNVPF